MHDATEHTGRQRAVDAKECSLEPKELQWTRNDVQQFLNEFFQGDVTLSQLVGAARRRFPNHKPLIHMEVDRYVEVFVLDLLRIVTTPNVVDALLTVETPQGRLGNLMRP